MAKSGDIHLTRRHLLQLATAISTLLALPTGVLAKTLQTGRKRALRVNKQLYDLVDRLIGQDEAAKNLRLAFDANPTQVIKEAGLTRPQWEILVGFKTSSANPKHGGEIEDEAAKYLPDPAKKAWRTKFDLFRAYWSGPNSCDGYTKPATWCPDHPGGTNCPKIANDDDVSLMYAYPKPRIDEVLPSGDTFEVRGEGFLSDSVVNVYGNATGTGKPVATYEKGATGTFRCSAFIFKPVGLKPGQYYLNVVNRVDGVEAQKPVNDTPQAFVVA